MFITIHQTAMFAPPLHVSYKVYGKGAESHPDLDDRCLQVAMEDRHVQQQRQRERRRRQRDAVAFQKDKSCRTQGVEKVAEDGGSKEEEENARPEDGLFVFSPAQEGWLIKQGSGGLRIWRRRWVGLANRRLWYANGPAAPGGSGGGDCPEKGSIGCMELTQWSRVVEEDCADGLSFRVIPGKPEDAYPSERVEEEEEICGAHSSDDEFDEGDSDGTPTHSLDGVADAAPSTGEKEPLISPHQLTRKLHQRRSIVGSVVSSSSQGHGHVPTEGWWFRAESLQEKEVWMTKIRKSIALAEWWSALRFGPSLGEGGFSQVVEMLDMRNGERLAVKVMHVRRRMERDQALAETDILALVRKRIQHPHLMAPRRIYVEGCRVWIMFPLCRGGDLLQRLVSRGRGSEAEAAVVVSRLLSAVQALHQHGVLHLDIKPENVLFVKEEDLSQVLLTDFGLSRKMQPTNRLGMRSSRYGKGIIKKLEVRAAVSECVAGKEGWGGEEEEEEEEEEEGREEETEEGDDNEEKEDAEQDWDYLSRLRYNLAFDERVNGTIGYMAPEVILHKRYTPSADVWSLGVVLHICLVGYAPFQHQQQERQQEVGGSCSSHQDALERSVRGEFVMDELDWARISPAAKDLTRRMLTVDETARITIADALRHPWVQHCTKKGEGVDTVGNGGKVRVVSSSVSAKKDQASFLPSNLQGHDSDHFDGGTTQPFSSFRTLFDSAVVRGSSFLSSITNISTFNHNGGSPPTTTTTSSSSSSSSSSLPVLSGGWKVNDV